MKKVSIIITLYNLKHFVGDAIQSVVDQTYENRECIIVDDCSTDGSFEFVQELIESRYFDYKDRFVVVQNPTNSRVGKTFEHGLQYATGDYIADLDADDVRLPNKLEVQIHYMDQNPDVIMSCHELIVTDEKLDVIADRFVEGVQGKKSSTFACDLIYLLKFNYAVGSSIVFRESAVKYMIPFSKYRYQDHWMASVCSMLGKIVFIRRQLVFYRQHGSNSEGFSLKGGILSRLRDMITKGRKSKELRANILNYNDFFNCLYDVVILLGNHKEIGYVRQKQVMYSLLHSYANGAGLIKLLHRAERIGTLNFFKLLYYVYLTS